MTQQSWITARFWRGAFVCCSVGALAAAAALIVKPALAEPQVQGTRQAVRIEARNSSVDEIMAALGRSFGLHYSSTANLGAPVSGTYEGSLKQVVARILAGHNFILSSRGERIDVTVFDTGGASHAVASSRAPAHHVAAAQTGTSIQPHVAAASDVTGKPNKTLARKESTPRAQSTPARTERPTAPKSNPFMRLAAGTESMAPPVPVQGGAESKGPQLRPSNIEPPKATQTSSSAPQVPMAKPQTSGPEVPKAVESKPTTDAPQMGSTDIKSGPAPK